MTESATTAEIRRWHTELRQGNEDWYDLAGELLDRLEARIKDFDSLLARDTKNLRRLIAANEKHETAEAEVTRLRGELENIKRELIARSTLLPDSKTIRNIIAIVEQTK